VQESLLLDAMYDSPYVSCSLDVPNAHFLFKGISQSPLFLRPTAILLFLLLPKQGVRHVLINEEAVKHGGKALYWSRGEGAEFWRAWAEEEANMAGKALLGGK
jgi:hypothetical protein